MNDLQEIQDLLRAVAEHLKADTKPDRRKAIGKLERIAAVASTLAFTLKARG